MRAMRISMMWALTLASGAACLAQPIPEMRPYSTPTTQAAQAPSMASPAQPPAPRLAEAVIGLQIKYVRDSAEYSTLMAQTYRVAADAVGRAKQALPTSATWAVVLDIDETVLDNSVYQLERATYGIGFDSGSWSAWVERAQAPAVPGVSDFLAAMRLAGGRVAFITNRAEAMRVATIRNLASVGVWREGDLLCLKQPSAGSSKAARRAELRDGKGQCAWPGKPARVLAYLGDQIGDFPAVGEEPGTSWAEAFGLRYFLLPNPMYGDWTSQVTR
ncbi:MAG: HAD family acid phosphatase [Thermoanaerobaculales bacterium]